MIEHIKKNLISYLFILGLIVVLFANRNNIFCAAVFNDEFGYWGNAATLSGKDWSALLARTPYYSMGYSLILIPLYKLGIQSAAMYKIAIVMNIGFMIISYVCALYVIRCLYPGLNDKLKQMICVASIASCTMLFYSQIAWCETFITTLMWCLIALFVCLERRWLYITPVLIVANIMAIYLTHQRAILLLPLAIGLLILNCIQNRKYMPTVYLYYRCCV